ncbi:MAG: protease SohB [Glaciecola sp.]|nr:protease SohB [Glaciecola sp.]MDG1921916.1 protease SohB [Glaciecola sp.]
MEFLFEYGLFFAKAMTVVMAIIAVLIAFVAIAMKQKGQASGKGQLEIHSISDALEDVTDYAEKMLLSDAQLKQFMKDKKAEEKAKAKADKAATKLAAKNKIGSDPNLSDSPAKMTTDKARLFVINFHGSVDAHEVANLREEITAILLAAEDNDEVLVNLESGGGVVHGYGLAASQLQRIKAKGLKLTICVDKVAASGGYMMACVADRLICANFAIIGSIGVIAQMPNFNKLLKKNDIDFEQHTAGDYKRTLTVFGENNDEGRAKFKAELEEVHVMFKDFVNTNRPSLDIAKVATGEYWFGLQAKELGLVDELATSDDIILELNKTHEIFSVKYSEKKNVMEKLGFAAENTMFRAYNRIFNQSQTPIS